MSKVLQSGCLFNEVYQKFYLILDFPLMRCIYCKAPTGKFSIQLFQWMLLCKKIEKTLILK